MKSLFTFCIALMLGLLLAPAAESKELKPVQQWQGSVESGKPEAQGVITTAAEFAAVWKKCARTEPLPEIDWAKHFAYFASTSGSILRVNPTVDDAGNVKALGIATADFRSGFRYVLLVLPRARVRTVNGEALAGP